jgi:hypothetical protein
MIHIASYTELMDADLIAALKSLASVDAPYPEALLAKRRAWFLARKWMRATRAPYPIEYRPRGR